MQSQRIFAFVVFLSIFIGFSSGATVTLTGTCGNIAQQGGTKYVNFTLLNSGDGTAGDMLLSAIPYGIQSNSETMVPILPPKGTNVSRFYIQNVTHNGTYGFGVDVSYVQDQQNFSVSFPCLVNLNSQTQPLLVVRNISTSGNKITATIMNFGTQNITASAYFVAPRTLQINQKEVRFTMLPESSYTFNATINSTPSLNESVVIAAIVSYFQNNESHSSMQKQVVRFSAGANSTPPQSTDFTWLLIAAPISAVLILIIASIFVNKRRKRTMMR